MLTRAGKVETRGVAWEATLELKTPPPQLRDLSDQGGMLDQEDVPEPEETDGFESAPTTPLSVWGWVGGCTR